VTDWCGWHTAYDDPESSLSRRLAVVRRRLAQAVGQDEVRSVLSLCAGDGRDIIPVLADSSAPSPDVVTLVELDPALASAARESAVRAGVDVEVVIGDAGATTTWASVPPVDLLLLCGIFGNIAPSDVLVTIEATPALLNPGATVIWTRGADADEDLRPQIRDWFQTAGLPEVSFDQRHRAMASA
jgi:hypothetical protein